MNTWRMFGTYAAMVSGILFVVSLLRDLDPWDWGLYAVLLVACAAVARRVNRPGTQ